MISPSIPFKEHYVTRTGSHAYGLATEHSDLDLRGFFFPADQNDALGFLGSSSHFTGLGDTTLWELRRFFSLASKGNPNVIETLFTEDEDIVSITPIAARVRDNRNLFVSSRILAAAVGFATSERLKIERKWDPKAASHVLRLMWQTCDLIANGTLRVRRPTEEAKMLVAVKQNQIDQVTVNKAIADSLAQLRHLEAKSKLPTEPDMAKLNDLCTELMREHLLGG